MYWQIPVAILVGIATWSIMEYTIHARLGHHGKGRNPFGKEHLRHHATTSYFAPSWKKAGVAVLVLVLLGPGAVKLVGLQVGLTYAISFVVFYLMYEIMHRRAHTHAPTGPYSRWMRKHHFDHHFKHPKGNYGVTSPIWDFVFGTYYPVEKVRVPRRHAMDWLVDPDSGDVFEKYSTDYELIGRAKGAAASESAPEEEPPSAI